MPVHAGRGSIPGAPPETARFLGTCLFLDPSPNVRMNGPVAPPWRVWGCKMLTASGSRVLSSCVRSTRLAVMAAALATCALPASAVQVTVGGTTYDISVLLNTSYSVNTVLLESQPWWGDAALAGDIITTYLANGGDTAADFGVGIVDFATGPSGPGTSPPGTPGALQPSPRTNTIAARGQSSRRVPTIYQTVPCPGGWPCTAVRCG